MINCVFDRITVDLHRCRFCYTMIDTSILSPSALLNSPCKNASCYSQCEYKKMETVGVVSTYFNPCNYDALRKNAERFSAYIREFDVQFVMVELSFDNRFIFDGSVKIKGDRQLNQSWQKERLLNIGKDHLPNVDIIGWFDADVEFLNHNWLNDLRSELSTHQVVQMFKDAFEYDGKNLEYLKPSVSYAFKNREPEYANLAKYHPGFAWAARSEWLNQFSLLDNCLTGGGDTLMIRGFTGRRFGIDKYTNPEWAITVDDWVDRVFPVVNGHMGYVDGALIHHKHGERVDRKYMGRWTYLTDYKYNPESDAYIDSNGLWAWTDYAQQCKPEMIQKISSYFSKRREDG